MPLIIHSYNSYLLYTHNVPGTVPSSRARPVNQADHETNQATRPQGAGGQPLKGLGDPEWQGALREVWRREGPLTLSSLAGHTGLIPTLFPPLKPNEPTPSLTFHCFLLMARFSGKEGTSTSLHQDLLETTMSKSVMGEGVSPRMHYLGDQGAQKPPLKLWTRQKSRRQWGLCLSVGGQTAASPRVRHSHPSSCAQPA